MRIGRLICAAAVAAILPAAALADDPHDPSMHSAAARALDHEMTRRQNLQEQASVEDRDARYAEGWRAWRSAGSDSTTNATYAMQSRAYEREMLAYSNDRARYDRQMAAWRRGVEACRAGDTSACER